MNYLAHSLLSGREEQLLIGNFIGDFIKGLPAKYNLPSRITLGVTLHRKIDAYSEQHPSLSQVKQMIPERSRRFASI